MVQFSPVLPSIADDVVGAWGQTSTTPAHTSCLESQSRPSSKPTPVCASHAWICHFLPQQILCRFNSLVRISTPIASRESCLLASTSKMALLRSFSNMSRDSSLCASERRDWSELSTTNIRAWKNMSCKESEEKQITDYNHLDWYLYHKSLRCLILVITAPICFS